MRVLIACDGSDQSQKALKHYLKLAQDGDEVTLYTAFPTVQVWDPSMELIDGLVMGKSEACEEQEQNLRAAWARRGENIIKKAKEAINEAGKSADDLVKHGVIKETDDVRHDIVLEAKKHEAEMIVLGSRGLGMVKKALLGSVSTWVSEHAELPVLIVH